MTVTYSSSQLPPDKDPVVEAVRKELLATEPQMAQVEQAVRRAEEMARHAREAREELAHKIEALRAYLRHRGAAPGLPTDLELSAEPTAQQATPPATEAASTRKLAPRSLRVEVTRRTAEMLAGGKAMRAEAILEALQAAGIQFVAEDPLHRLRQILSRDRRFVSGRQKGVKGWTLKNEAPSVVTEGASSTTATESTGPTPEV